MGTRMLARSWVVGSIFAVLVVGCGSDPESHTLVVARGAATDPCPPGPDQVAATVTSTISFDAASGLYTYSYRVSNDATSVQPIDAVEIVAYRPDAVDFPSGWGGGRSFDPRLVRWVAIADPADAELVTNNPSVPPSAASIWPGSVVDGFTFRSVNPPGPVSYVLYGYSAVPFTPGDPSTADDEWEEFAADIAGRCSLAGAGGETTGPVDPGGVVPDAPAPPSFSDVTDSRITVRWETPVAGAVDYELECAGQPSDTTADEWFLVAAGLQSGLYQHDFLASDSTYWYRVRAVNAGGAPGPWSEERSVRTLPDAPDTLNVSDVTNTSVRLQWEQASGLYNYRVERAPDASGSPGQWSAVATELPSTEYVDAVQGNTTYWYRVAAVGHSGMGAYTATVSVTSLPNAPAAPTFSNVGPSTVTVGWTAPTGGAASYEVERATSSTGPWTQLAAGLATLTYVDATVTANVAYWYRVGATNPTGSNYSRARRLLRGFQSPGRPEPRHTRSSRRVTCTSTGRRRLALSPTRSSARRT